MREDRPTWTLGEQTLAAAYPARDVDLDEAFHRAFAVKRSYSRMDEVSDLVKQMAAYHIEAAGDAYTDLAMLARGAGVAPWNGWQAALFDCDIPGVTEILLTRENAPGGLHVSIRNEPAYRPSSEEEVKKLQAAIPKELDELGVPKNKRFMRGLFGKEKNESPSEILLRSLEKRHESYRAPMAGDAFSRLIVTAVNIKGAPSGIPSQDSSKLSAFAGKDVDKDYFSGEQLSISRDIYTREDNILSPNNVRVAGSTDVVLQVLSGILEENGLSPMIADTSEKLSELPWRAFGDEHSAEIMDVANAAAYRSKGLFDEAAAKQVMRYSRAIAAKDIAGLSEEITPLARGLVEKGFTSSEDTFDANDMRDIAHAMAQDGKLQLFSETQNGTYRMDISLDDAGDVQFLEAHEISSGKDIPIGRFFRSDKGWSEDYDGQINGGPPIAYDIRSVRHMNNLIMSMSSLSCVFEDEYQDDCPAP